MTAGVSDIVASVPVVFASLYVFRSHLFISSYFIVRYPSENPTRGAYFQFRSGLGVIKFYSDSCRRMFTNVQTHRTLVQLKITRGFVTKDIAEIFLYFLVKVFFDLIDFTSTRFLSIQQTYSALI